MAIERIDKNTAKLVVSFGSGKHRKRFAKQVTYSGKKDLERKYREFEEDCKNGGRSDILVTELVDSYIRNRELLGIKPTTIHGYRACEKRIQSFLSGIKAVDLTTYRVDDFIVSMGRKYAPKTIGATISLLNSAYDRAVKTGQLRNNPCKYATLPKQKRKEIQTLNAEEIQIFLQELNNERLDIKVGYELCLMCGLRRSEVLGLREGDINLLFKTVSIHQTRHIVDRKEYVSDTKTERSNRTLAIPETLCMDIDKLIREHHAQPYYHSDYLIQNGFGEPLHPATFSDQIMHVLNRANLPHVSVHGLRHTFATLLNSAGIDMARISAELGHSNLSTTMNIYTHVFGNTSESSRGIANAIEESLKTDSKRALDEKEKA